MKIHLASKCFSSSSNFSKKGKPFKYLSWWRKNKPLDGLHHHKKRQASQTFGLVACSHLSESSVVAVVVVVAVIVACQPRVGVRH